MIFRDWKLLRFYLIWVYRGPPAAQKAFQPTDPGKAWLIEKGSVRMLVAGKETIVESGNWVFPPAYLDERQFSEDAELLSIRFRVRWPDGEDIFQHPDPIVCPASEEKHLTDLANRLNDRASEISEDRGKEIGSLSCDLFEYMDIQGLVASWVGQYANCLIRLGHAPHTPQTSDALLEEVRRRIEELPAEMAFSRQYLADSMGVSISHLESIFAKQYGKTPTQYWQDCRFHKARDLLRAHDGPIKQVAFALGFKSVARFSTWFKKHAGVSPSTFSDQ